MLRNVWLAKKIPLYTDCIETLDNLEDPFYCICVWGSEWRCKKHSDSHRWVVFLVHQIGGAFFCNHLKFISTHSLRYLSGNSVLTRPMEIHPTPWVGCSLECEHERHMLRICPGLGPVLFLRQYQPTLLSAIFNHNPSFCPLDQT